MMLLIKIYNLVMNESRLCCHYEKGYTKGGNMCSVLEQALKISLVVYLFF